MVRSGVGPVAMALGGGWRRGGAKAVALLVPEASCLAFHLSIPFLFLGLGQSPFLNLHPTRFCFRQVLSSLRLKPIQPYPAPDVLPWSITLPILAILY